MEAIFFACVGSALTLVGLWIYDCAMKRDGFRK